MSLVIAIIAGVLTLVLLFRPFFGCFEDFVECLRFWLMPDILSFLRGELEDDWISEFKLWFWGGLGFAVGASVYAGLNML